jgi:hypothetical protein
MGAVSLPLREIVGRAIATDASQRWDRAGEFRDALSSLELSADELQLPGPEGDLQAILPTRTI